LSSCRGYSYHGFGIRRNAHPDDQYVLVNQIDGADILTVGRVAFALGIAKCQIENLSYEFEAVN
jgi:hypothetical protein